MQSEIRKRINNFLLIQFSFCLTVLFCYETQWVWCALISHISRPHCFLWSWFEPWKVHWFTRVSLLIANITQMIQSPGAALFNPCSECIFNVWNCMLHTLSFHSSQILHSFGDTCVFMYKSTKILAAQMLNSNPEKSEFVKNFMSENKITFLKWEALGRGLFWVQRSGQIFQGLSFYFQALLFWIFPRPLQVLLGDNFSH